MTVFEAAGHVVGAGIAWAALMASLSLAYRKLYQRSTATELAAVALSLKIPAAAIAEPVYETQAVSALLERNSPDLLRNRLSDFAGTAAWLLGWLVAFATAGLTGTLIYVCIRDSSLSEVPVIWGVPGLLFAYGIALACIAGSCYLLTGRLPGQAKQTRRVVTSY